jgi:L-alanine-DL-glutamate epimerase-like enolase superfamily enzyme
VKIARIEPFHVQWGGGRSRSAWVRIWNDAGVHGLGEASPMVHGNASLEIIASALAPMLLGADPLEAWTRSAAWWRRGSSSVPPR